MKDAYFYLHIHDGLCISLIQHIMFVYWTGAYMDYQIVNVTLIEQHNRNWLLHILGSFFFTSRFLPHCTYISFSYQQNAAWEYAPTCIFGHMAILYKVMQPRYVVLSNMFNLLHKAICKSMKLWLLMWCIFPIY